MVFRTTQSQEVAKVITEISGKIKHSELSLAISWDEATREKSFVNLLVPT